MSWQKKFWGTFGAVVVVLFLVPTQTRQKDARGEDGCSLRGIKTSSNADVAQCTEITCQLQAADANNDGIID
eukprot:981773-Amphidinium_carterae.1